MNQFWWLDHLYLDHGLCHPVPQLLHVRPLQWLCGPQVLDFPLVSRAMQPRLQLEYCLQHGANVMPKMKHKLGLTYKGLAQTVTDCSAVHA